MLLDSFHRRWILVSTTVGAAALGLYLWLDYSAPASLTGGSTVGLWYGTVGAGLMIYAGLLSALRRVPSLWWLGSRKVWLRGHIWLGLLSTVFLLCHSGFRWGGTLERILWVVFALTLLTGIFGLILQQFVPRLMTARLEREAPYEQIPHICKVLQIKADELAAKISVAEVGESMTNVFASQVGVGARVQFQKFYEKHIRPFLIGGESRSTLLANPLEAEQAFTRLRALPGLIPLRKDLAELQSLCDERRALAEQERLHRWLHLWLLVHVPLSVALLVLGLAHAVVALYY